MTETTITYRNYIDGTWQEASGGETYELSSPGRTEETVGYFPLSTPDDVVQAVDAAHRRFQDWKTLTPSERTAFIYRFVELLGENRERLAEAAVLEQGKVYAEALAEPTRGTKELIITAGEALRLEGIARPSDSKRTVNVAHRVPIGVIAAITPWNFPILTPLRKIVPALVAGCTVVFKPATATPLTAVIITELFEQAGLPGGALNLVVGAGREIGDALVSNPLIRGVSFTGSTTVGRSINEKVASNFTKVQLEMGGKNAAVVVNYRDLDFVARKIVKAAFSNAGQRCTAISRVIVHDSQAEELERLLVEHAARIRVGHGRDENVEMGPVTSAHAVETMNEYVESARSQGAVVATGGEPLRGGIFDSGYYYKPTVITGVTPEMRVAREEIFGPVLVVLRVSSREEAIKVTNDTEYGLTTSLFTDEMDFTYDFTENVEVGMVRINNLGVSGGNMPFGGVKNSGLGPFGIGSTSMDFYTNMKVVYREY
jgi:alpha-ketoglutaric semialdehyde dehydrogenase